MKSSRSRSRNKNRSSNRPTGGNVINRVFDSSGPEGKVRGTPQQIIEKYNQLARDAQLANDRVAAENFQQHAEHYLRLLSEAQREIDTRREEQERQNRERQAERDRERAERQERDSGHTAPQEQAGDPGAGEQPDLVEPEDSNLVETPEEAAAKPKPKPKSTKPRAPRKPRAPKSGTSDQSEGGASGQSGESGAPEAAE